MTLLRMTVACLLQWDLLVLLLLALLMPSLGLACGVSQSDPAYYLPLAVGPVLVLLLSRPQV